MEQRKGITCAGNWIIDHVKIIERWPDEGLLTSILSEKRGTGGAPYNVLTGLAKLGTRIPLSAMGMVGDDENGKYILSHCQSMGIDISGITTTKEKPTSYTDVMTVKGTGKRTFFHNRGANTLFSEKHLSFEKNTAKLFHMGYLLLLDSMDLPDDEYGTKAAKVFARAQQAGLKTSLDIVSEMSDRFRKLVPPSLPYIDYLIVNELEAGQTTGHLIRNGEELDTPALKTSARALLKMGVKERVVIHFPEGAYALTKEGEEQIQPSLQLPAEYIQGTAGAGDAFCGGMLYGIHEDWKLCDSLKLGIAMAAACLSDASTTDGMRTLEETMQLLTQYTFKTSSV